MEAAAVAIVDDIALVRGFVESQRAHGRDGCIEQILANQAASIGSKIDNLLQLDLSNAKLITDAVTDGPWALHVELENQLIDRVSRRLTGASKAKAPTRKMQYCLHFEQYMTAADLSGST